MSKLNPDGIDFVRRILVDHHVGARLDPDDNPETRLWHLFVTLCTYAHTEHIDVRELFDDAARYEATDDLTLAFNMADVARSH